MFCPIPTAPKLASVTGTSSSFDSVQLLITLQYNGGSRVTAIRIEFRVAGTTNVLSEYTTNYLITNATITSWDFNVTDLQYEESGYEVIATPSNSIGQGNGFVSQPINLFTGSCINNLYNNSIYICFDVHDDRLILLSHINQMVWLFFK